MPGLGDIRLQDEKKAGQLLAEREKVKGAASPAPIEVTTRSSDTTTSTKTLRELGISKDQS